MKCATKHIKNLNTLLIAIFTTFLFFLFMLDGTPESKTILFSIFIIFLILALSYNFNRKKCLKMKETDSLINTLSKADNYDSIKFIDAETSIGNRLAMITDNKKEENIAMFDVKNFSNISHTYGHDISNKILYDFFDRLQKLLPENSIGKIYRYDVDVAALCTMCAFDDFVREVDRISDSIRFYFYEDKEKGLKIPIVIITGIAAYENNPYDTITSAENALKTAKSRGIYKCIWIEGTLCSSENNYMLHSNNVSLFYDSMQSERIVPFFQPIINLKTGEIQKVEMLTRIKSGNSYSLPRGFIGSIEKMGLSPILFQKIFPSAWELAEKNINVSVNISTSDIMDDSVIEMITHFLSSDTKRAKKITFELLETHDDNFNKSLTSFARKVKNLGARVSIDDFGIGYSNFKRVMSSMNVDIIKIDGSIISKVTKDSTSRAIMYAIVAMCKECNIKTIAEWVEDKECYDLIRHAGVDMAQGRFLSDALHIDDLIPFLTDSQIEKIA